MEIKKKSEIFLNSSKERTKEEGFEFCVVCAEFLSLVSSGNGASMHFFGLQYIVA